MKHLFIFTVCVIILLAVIATHAFAASTPTPTTIKKPTITDKATNDKLSEQINNLKDRIASKVAELQLVEKGVLSARWMTPQAHR